MHTVCYEYELVPSLIKNLPLPVTEIHPPRPAPASSHDAHGHGSTRHKIYTHRGGPYTSAAIMVSLFSSVPEVPPGGEDCPRRSGARRLPGFGRGGRGGGSVRLVHIIHACIYAMHIYIACRRPYAESFARPTEMILAAPPTQSPTPTPRRFGRGKSACPWRRSIGVGVGGCGGGGIRCGAFRAAKKGARRGIFRAAALPIIASAYAAADACPVAARFLAAVPCGGASVFRAAGEGGSARTCAHPSPVRHGHAAPYGFGQRAAAVLLRCNPRLRSGPGSPLRPGWRPPFSISLP